MLNHFRQAVQHLGIAELFHDNAWQMVSYVQYQCLSFTAALPCRNIWLGKLPKNSRPFIQTPRLFSVCPRSASASFDIASFGIQHSWFCQSRARRPHCWPKASALISASNTEALHVLKGCFWPMRRNDYVESCERTYSPTRRTYSSAHSLRRRPERPRI